MDTAEAVLRRTAWMALFVEDLYACHKTVEAVAQWLARTTITLGSPSMLQIEPYETADLPVIEAFIEALHDAERELMPILSPSSELAAAGLRQILHDTSTDKGMVLLAKSEDRPIGFGCVLFDDHRDPSYHEAERRRAYLAYLYITAEWRPSRRRSGAAGVHGGGGYSTRLFEIPSAVPRRVDGEKVPGTDLKERLLPGGNAP